MRNALLSLGLLLSSCSTPVLAHSWYDPWCCNDKDCQGIPTEAVELTAQGYRVTLRPQDHGMLRGETAPHVYVVAYRDARVSPDGGYHACIYPDVETMRCFYAPPVGS